MKNRLRVLCFHPALAPYRVDFFNLLAERVDLKVVFLERNVPAQKFDQKALQGSAAFDFNFADCGFKIRGRVVRFGLLRRIRKICPNVILSFEASPITVLLCCLKCLAHWKLWTHMDEAPTSIRSRRGLRRWIRDWAIRHCDGVLVPSDEAARAYREVVGYGKYVTVPIIHDVRAIRRDSKSVLAAGKVWRREMGLGHWDKILIFVGRLVTAKNVKWLLEQFNAETKHGLVEKNIGLVIVGEGLEAACLQRYVELRGLKAWVSFAGKLQGRDLYAVMSAADALVLPSTFEPFGAVVAEAMQWGTPVIVSDRVGAKTLVNKDNGVVYRHDDRESFFSGLEKVMKLKSGTDSILPVLLTDAVNNLVKEMSK